ncbi:MAG: PEGA domain-containing protein [Pseudomonadales bacterium]|nr:PEGA domain-containing protein [Pseudomonadales bacterium]
MSADEENLVIEPATFQRASSGLRRRGFRLRPVPVAIAVAFLVLALVVTFIIGARAVRFNIDPRPASIEIVSGFITYRLGERFLMWPGNYRVEARLPGYEVLDRTVTVGDDEDQDIAMSMVKLPGILHVSTDPGVDAEVFVDQQSIGNAPATMNVIAPGVHDIRIETARYKPYDTEVEIEGKRIEQSVVATLVPAWANVSVSTIPDGATLIVDGKEIAGESPLTVELLEGTREVRLRRPGYKTWESELKVTAGEDMSMPLVRLVRSDGKINIVTDPPGANVAIAGRYRGQTPLEVALPPGAAYEILLSKAGYEPLSRSIRVDAEADVALNATLQPVLGVLRLMVEPAGATLSVDGQVHGDPDTRLTLTARPHTIEVSKPGYATFTTTVNPQPGLAQQLMVHLQTEQEARVASIPDTIDAGDDISLRLILPGHLHMGAPRREPGRRSNEIEKDVELTRAYYLSINEITNEQFTKFMPNHDSGMLGRSVLTEPNRPVVNVSWEDAARFCNWLSERDGLSPAYVVRDGRLTGADPMTNGYRLPTEAEWAWAARYADGPNPTRFPWGDAMPPPVVSANYADETARAMVPYYIAGYNDNYRGPAPVGSFPANAFGIHDLAGNVSEWIHDFYSIELYPDPLTDPVGPQAGDYHVIRGSNYTHGQFGELRWTFRDYGKDGRPDVGFRIARYLE